jgi:hypothetical protein
MGQTLRTRRSSSRKEQTVLARAVDDAVARIGTVDRAEAGEDELAEMVDRLLTEVDGFGEARAAAPPEAAALPHVPLPFVFLDGLEVTQEIQDMAHSVPLLARKGTIVRAYLQYRPHAVTVRGELLVARTPLGPWHPVTSLGPAQLDPSRAGHSLADLRSRRDNLDYSLDFRLPEPLTSAGTVWLRMGRIRRTNGTPLPSFAGLPLRHVTFRPSVPLRIRLVLLRYTMGNPPVLHEPSATDVALIRSWLGRAYPTAEVDLTTTTTDALPAAPFGASQINAQLIALRAVDVSTGTDARTHYYGMVADSGFFMRGLASGIPQTPQPGTVASGPTGPSGFGWDTDGSYGDWYGGHELGHTFGRFHAEFCGAVGGAPYPFDNGQLSNADEAFVGIDVGDPALGLPLRLLNGITSHDVMTYCDNEWLSSFTYGGVYDRLIAEAALPAGAGGAVALPALGELGGSEPSDVRVIASLNLTRATGSITSVLPGSAGADSAGADSAGAEGDDDVRVRVRDVDGAVIDDRPASFTRSACEDPADDVTGVVDAVLPSSPAAASVEIVVKGQVVDTHPVGGETVAVGELVHPDPAFAGAGGTPERTMHLRWEAPGASTGQRYIVQVSDDDGTTWRTVAVGLAEPAVRLSRDEFTGDTVTVRVLATTGTGTTVVRTESVRVR